MSSLQEAIGEELWSSAEQRLLICESCGYSYFLATFLSAKGLLAFLESGQLSPDLPEKMRTGIQDFDDEWHMIGHIDALREIERYAVNRGQVLDLDSVKICLGAAQSLEEALMQFSFRNGDLRRRFDGVKYAVKRLESLAYEIDLAQQRIRCSAAAGMGDMDARLGDDARQPAVGDAPAIDLALIGNIKARYEEYDLRREESIKRSRDVLKLSKNAIYALQRNNLKQADEHLSRCAKEASKLYEEVTSTSPTLRLGFFSNALEEMAEALSYRAFLQGRALLSPEEMQECSGLSFPLNDAEYLGGIMDLTGEVGRLAIRSAGRGKKGRDDIEACLACVDAVYNGAQAMPYLPRDLSKKIGPLKQTLTKIEGALYELALLSDGFGAPRGGGLEAEASDA